MSGKFVKNLPVVILLDTNAVARLTQYVEACAYICGVPDISNDKNLNKVVFVEYEEIRKKMEQKGLQKFMFRERIKEGYKLYTKLIEKNRITETQIFFSLLSEIELLNVFLDAAMEQELTRRKMPYRIRRRKPFRTQFFLDYEKNVKLYWENLKEILGIYNIALYSVEEEVRDIRKIIETAKVILRYLALEPFDLYIYSSAICVGADFIYTFDNENFRKVINDFRNSPAWEITRDALIKELDIRELPKGKTP
ncbi:MAG: hypothetical protein B6D56_07995 [Candidatus Omnitrophica bacterium 4484_70.1]|nr:MAG: hypothetical protein B6D56_07995 [Candidatus Omnitrophica bacterium 4484_70.1]